MFEPIEKSRAFERVVEQIEEAIYSGELRPGDHLPSERTLVERFQVGRSSVREALRILESRGLLQTQSGSPKGPRVSGATTNVLAKALEGVVRIEQISLFELVQYRMITGSAANFLAAHLRTEEHLDRMEATLEAMASAAMDDSNEFARHDTEFHAVVAQAAGNNFLNVVGEVINEVIINVMVTAIESAPSSDEVRRSFLDLHRKILEAIRTRDAAGAARLARSSLVDAYGPLLSPVQQERLKILE